MPEKSGKVPISEGLAEILRELGYGGIDEFNRLLTVIHPVDLAEILQFLEPEDRAEFFRHMEPKRAGDVLEAMSPDIRLELAEDLGEKRLAGIIPHVEPDVAADVLPALSSREQDRVLATVDEEHREDIESLRRYEPQTAGGIMTPKYIEVPHTATCAQAIQAIHGNLDAETIDTVYVTREGRLEGVSSIREVLTAKPDTPIASVMTSGENLRTVEHTDDQEVVARMVQKYDLKAVPVVDGSGRLVGIVTVDDVIDVIQEEVSEDIFRLAGADRVHPLHESVIKRVWVRMPWLAVTVAAQLGIAWAIRGYGETLQKFWLLSAFFPIIMAIGGNVGIQSATLVVRGLATGEITVGRSFRVVFAEVRVGLLIGIACGAVSGLMAYLMEVEGTEAFDFGLIVFLSMLAGITFAAGFGTVLPFVFQRCGIDPAVASGPFITTLNDILSIVIYLSLATVLIL